MPFIGNQPALSYTSFAKQDFTTSATTSYTLDNPVTNENELALFINFVRQEPTTAYTASGTTLTLTSATSASDDMYCVFLGKAVQTVNPPNGSVDSSKINYPLTTFSSTGIDDNATSTAVTIDSSENVGIGETSPSSLLHLKNATPNLIIQDTGTAGTDATPTITFKDTSSTQGTINFNNGGDMEIIQSKANALKFKTSDTERMRIASDGVVGIGTSSPNSNYRLSVVAGSGAIVGAFIETTSTNSGHEASIIKRPNSGVLVQFLGSGQVGSITTNGSTTTYGTSSDYRLKENIVEITDATARLKQLKPKRFNFIADADTTVDGFIAHEVQDVVPEAIYGEKDAMKTEEYEVTPAVLDEDGNVITEAVMGTRVVPDYQGIDQSKLVPLLVKTIQELEARITQLENA